MRTSGSGHWHLFAASTRPVGSTVMRDVSRRTLLGMSAGGLALLLRPASALAEQCVTGPYPGFLPNQLTVDCASRRNFQLFRQNAAYLGLAGVVSMTFVRGKLG